MKLLRRPFPGSGRLPDDLRSVLSREGLLILEERLPGSVTYHHYRGRDLRGERSRSAWRKELTSGSIAVTPHRLVVWVWHQRGIDVPRTGAFRQAVRVTIPKPDQVRFDYDAGRFHLDRSGQVEITLRTPNAADIDALLAGDGRY